MEMHSIFVRAFSSYIKCPYCIVELAHLDFLAFLQIWYLCLYLNENDLGFYTQS